MVCVHQQAIRIGRSYWHYSFYRGSYNILLLTCLLRLSLGVNSLIEHQTCLVLLTSVQADVRKWRRHIHYRSYGLIEDLIVLVLLSSDHLVAESIHTNRNIWLLFSICLHRSYSYRFIRARRICLLLMSGLVEVLGKTFDFGYIL